MATVEDVENCYRFILGREMSLDEKRGVDGGLIAQRNIGELRHEFLKSSEFYNLHLETMFESLVPQSIPVLYHASSGFSIYLDLRQLHISFGVLNEAYDRAEIELIGRVLPEAGVFVDVGANCGYYSLAVAANTAFHGKIVAFEPLLPLAGLFARSITANGWQDKIELRQVALGHAPGVLPLTDAELGINAGATRLAIGASARASHRTVSVSTLDNELSGVTADVIKVDIEGAEGLFFHGARETMQRSKPTLLFEMNPELLSVVSNVAPDDLRNWLENFRYRLWSIEPEGLAPVPTKQRIGELIGRRGMKNFLAVHSDRIPALRERLGELMPQEHVLA